MRRKPAFSIGMLLFSVMFLAGVCVAAGPDSIPTTAKWTGTLYEVGLCTFVPPGSHIMTVNVGKGVSSVIGPADFVFVYCTDHNTFIGSGWGIITTANGDRIHLHIPVLSVTFPENAPPVWTETETIVGGTGKFENAIGISFSQGIWTFDTAAFPFGTSETPPLLLPSQGWVGTSVGEITLKAHLPTE